MRCPTGHTMYHARPARPYHIPCHSRQVLHVLSIMSCPPGHTGDIHLALPVRLYHIPCHGIYQAIPYTRPSPMPCLPGHNHIPCDAQQAILCTMRGPPGHTIYHNMIARPNHISYHACKVIPYHITCHAARPYHVP